jgi:hypothetical protein
MSKYILMRLTLALHLSQLFAEDCAMAAYNVVRKRLNPDDVRVPAAAASAQQAHHCAALEKAHAATRTSVLTCSRRV